VERKSKIRSGPWNFSKNLDFRNTREWSVPPVSWRRLDRGQLGQVEIADRAQNLRRGALFEARRQTVEPGGIFGLGVDEGIDCIALLPHPRVCGTLAHRPQALRMVGRESGSPGHGGRA
jgi:hypothetical protein